MVYLRDSSAINNLLQPEFRHCVLWQNRVTVALYTVTRYPSLCGCVCIPYTLSIQYYELFEKCKITIF